MLTIFYTQMILLICYPQASWVNEHSEVKRKKLEIKLESDDANDNFTFPETMSRRDKRGEETERYILYYIVIHKHSLHCFADLNGSLPSMPSTFVTQVETLL
jgi:hypothetical protein